MGPKGPGLGMDHQTASDIGDEAASQPGFVFRQALLSDTERFVDCVAEIRPLKLSLQMAGFV
jgi:hypothetical protein